MRKDFAGCSDRWPHQQGGHWAGIAHPGKEKILVIFKASLKMCTVLENLYLKQDFPFVHSSCVTPPGLWNNADTAVPFAGHCSYTDFGFSHILIVF